MLSPVPPAFSLCVCVYVAIYLVRGSQDEYEGVLTTEEEEDDDERANEDAAPGRLLEEGGGSDSQEDDDDDDDDDTEGGDTDERSEDDEDGDHDSYDDGKRIACFCCPCPCPCRTCCDVRISASKSTAADGVSEEMKVLPSYPPLERLRVGSTSISNGMRREG